MIIGAGEFKAKCLKLMDKVNQEHEEIIITKRNHPIAKLVPINKTSKKSILGLLKDSMIITGYITKPLGEKWCRQKLRGKLSRKLMCVCDSS